MWLKDEIRSVTFSISHGEKSRSTSKVEKNCSYKSQPGFYCRWCLKIHPPQLLHAVSFYNNRTSKHTNTHFCTSLLSQPAASTQSSLAGFWLAEGRELSISCSFPLLRITLSLFLPVSGWQSCMVICHHAGIIREGHRRCVTDRLSRFGPSGTREVECQCHAA